MYVFVFIFFSAACIYYETLRGCKVSAHNTEHHRAAASLSLAATVSGRMISIVAKA